MKKERKKEWMDFSVTGRKKEKARVMAQPYRIGPGNKEGAEEYRISLNGCWDFMLAEGEGIPEPAAWGKITVPGVWQLQGWGCLLYTSPSPRD